jgi:glucan-binding YG repeat protein
MTKAKLIDTLATAIQAADSSYFNENYTKQAQAALTALEKAGYAVLPKEFPDDTWEKAAGAMKTGRVKPAEHVKNVYETVLKVVGN